MCDSFVALPKVTQDGNLLFAKNSDREPDEAQAIVHQPRKINTQSVLQCTYITIPQVTETYECILSKPFQMWGAEMGVNEHGLVIGNEAVFTKVKFEKHNNGLTGMDMLRVALERCKSAPEAINCITSLLDVYGQNACGGYRNKNFYYHNSFLLADLQGAWVLETAGKEWAVQEVRDIRSISNRLSISIQVDQLSSTAMSYAKAKGWWHGKDPFSFGNAYSSWFYTKMSKAAHRQMYTSEACKQRKGNLNTLDCMQILQTHNIDYPDFKPNKANAASVCMHKTGLLNPSQTTGSMVTKLRAQGPHTVWLTGTSMPCLSVYLPFYFNTNVLKDIKMPSALPDDSLWWRAEKIHQWICKDYIKRRALINAKREALQLQFVTREYEILQNSYTTEMLEKFSRESLSEFEFQLKEWEKLII